MIEKLYFQEGEKRTEYTAEQYAQHAKDLAEIAARQVEPTIAEKLESVGLSIPDLKAALGL